MIIVSPMETGNRELLIEGAKAFGIHLKEEMVDLFDRYLKELLKWNQKINLTAIRTEKGVILKHFLDSLSVCPYLPGSSFLLDLGSGAGVPGIPLKIVQPSFEVTLIDSVLKKVDFQRHIIRILGLKGIEAVHGRVQEKGVLKEMEGRFDIVISRAFSDLETFLKLSFPFLRKGGRVVAMKGEVDEGGLQLASKAEEIRFAFQKTKSFTLPFSSFKRTILLFEKR
ncbi:MAG: 16S rRNA (guanine(527)-N(7))-methyltransferase RsmG [Deltaproteobacteria bacterium]